MSDLKDQLSLLGTKTVYKQEYAPEVLEAFDNKHPEHDYWVRFNCPEFTSLCPITGQPDFAEIRIAYIPRIKMVESKSLKLYLFSFRNHGAFHEDCVLEQAGVEWIFAYNACFDRRQLPELGSFSWYDIMKIAAYRQHNPASVLRKADPYGKNLFPYVPFEASAINSGPDSLSEQS